MLRDFRPEWLHQDVTAPIYAESAGWDPVARMQYLDLFTWLRGDILVKADKMTMANSLELRVPFLDPEVFRVAEQIPYQQKLTNRRNARKSGMPATTKYALRKALEEIVPAHVLHRPKLGFPVPLRHWLAGPELYDWVADHITASETDHIFDKAAVMQMLVDHRAGVTDNSRRIWNVLVFMIWHGIFVENRISPEIEEPAYDLWL